MEVVELYAIGRSRSAVGVAQGPPNALVAPKPTSSRRMTKTFGAPSGGRSGSSGGNLAAGSFASSYTGPVYGGSGIGRWSRTRAWRHLSSSDSGQASAPRIPGRPTGQPSCSPHPDSASDRGQTAVNRLLTQFADRRASAAKRPAAQRKHAERRREAPP